MKIIYKTPEGTVTVLIPSSNWVGTSGEKIKNLTADELSVAMEELAQKDVPTGVKYKIVEDSVIPSDGSFRNAWEVDEAELTDGVGA